VAKPKLRQLHPVAHMKVRVEEDKALRDNRAVRLKLGRLKARLVAGNRKARARKPEGLLEEAPRKLPKGNRNVERRKARKLHHRLVRNNLAWL
jgi:hypothetical protein